MNSKEFDKIMSDDFEFEYSVVSSLKRLVHLLQRDETVVALAEAAKQDEGLRDLILSTFFTTTRETVAEQVQFHDIRLCALLISLLEVSEDRGAIDFVLEHCEADGTFYFRRLCETVAYALHGVFVWDELKHFDLLRSFSFQYVCKQVPYPDVNCGQEVTGTNDWITGAATFQYSNYGTSRLTGAA